MAYLNLASIRLCTESEGPGRRFAIWVQGCHRRCDGCCNPEMQEMRKNIIVNTADLTDLIASSQVNNQIDGVTFVGGEPFLQAEGCAEIASWCKQHGLSVLAFSGFLYEELKEMGNTHVNAFLRSLDVLVDGPFVSELYDYDRDWIGSKNQKVWYFTDRYDNSIERTSIGHQTEFLVSDTEILINGWPF